MVKWFAYIVTLLIFAPCLSFGSTKNKYSHKTSNNPFIIFAGNEILIDTAKNNKKPAQDERVKIKEITKTKKQPKPEKLEPADNSGTSKARQRPKRQRRPEGLERPPEIPRRNGN